MSDRRLSVAGITAAFSFLALAAALFVGPLASIDRAASELAVGYRTWLLTVLFTTVTVLGNGSLLAPMLAATAVVGMAQHKLRRPCLWMVGLAVSAGIVDSALKLLFARPRPEEWASPLLREVSYSFPSGHAMIAMCLMGFLCYLAATAASPRLRPLAWVLAALVVLVGCSRIYLGVHYPADVLGGYLAGIPLLSVAIATYRRPAAASGPR